MRRMTPAARKIADTDWHLSRLYDLLARWALPCCRPTTRATSSTSTGRPTAQAFTPEPPPRACARPRALSAKPCTATTPRPRRGRDRAARRPVLAALPRRLAAGAIALAGKAHPRAALGSAFDRQRTAPPFRRTAAGSEHRHLRRRRMRALAARGCHRGGKRRSVQLRSTPASREATLRATMAAPMPAHAVQLEMARCLYMDEGEPFPYREDRAAAVLPTVESMVRNTLRALEALQ